MHSALLQELDRAVPIFPVSKYLARKPSLADKLTKGASLVAAGNAIMLGSVRGMVR